MAVNHKESEVIWVGKNRLSDKIDLNGNLLTFAEEIKALGIYINGSL